MHLRLLDWALDEARSAEATVGSAGWAEWASRLSAGRDGVRAALSWALGGQEPEAGRELAAPARPVVDRHRPVQRSGPVPDHGGRHPLSGGSRPPGPGADRRRLVGVPPG